MSVLPKNHWVRYRSEEEIANVAEKARQLLKVDYLARLDIIKAVKQFVGASFKSNGKLEVEIFDGLRDGRFAYVTFKPLKICIERETWDHAILGDPYSRFVIAHELGHATLHSETAKAFSTTEVKFNIHGLEEHSAEWQADTFALHILMPDDMLFRVNNEVELAEIANVELWRASSRLNSLRTFRMKKQKPSLYLGDTCPVCGEFILNAKGFVAQCGGCGFKSRLIG